MLTKGVAALHTGVVTPSAVAERVIKFLEAHNDKNHWLSAWSAQHIRDAAAAATERYAAGKPLSVLDGVPFVVKDCIDALPYDTSYGTRFMAQL
jgi:Asp-tRNA(Asn)/Glu-tRNA(Gln) amidotransferase A subunit family amidase